jgi:imidazolonepropionase-like amidohydrolase
MMAEKEIFFVPTLYVTQYAPFTNMKGRTDFQIERSKAALEAHRTGFRKAIKAGVKIACGCDANPIAECTLVEIEQMVEAGMTEMQALRSATQVSAELCGVADRLGTVEAGKLADLIAVEASPLEDISNLRKLRLVMKAGEVVDITPTEGVADFEQLFFS